MQRRFPWLRLAGVAGILAALMLFLQVVAPPFRVASDPDLTAAVNAAFIPRSEDANLHTIAHQRAVEIASDFSHTGIRSGTAEVLAWSSGSDDPVALAVSQWATSPTHAAILSDPSYTLIGCGSYLVENRSYFACVLTSGPSPTPVTVPAPPDGTGPAVTPQALPNTATTDFCTRRPNHWKCASPSPSASTTIAPSATATPQPTATPSPSSTPVPTTPAPTPSPTASPPTSTPSQSPSPTAACTRYLAPTGSDSNPGTLSAPWRTLIGSSPKMVPGDTVCLRGGTYSGQGGYGFAADGTSTARITVQSYPGEHATFDGNGQPQWVILSDVDHVTFRDLTITDYNPENNGVVILINGTDDVTLDTLTVTGNYGYSPSGYWNEHAIYPGAGVGSIVLRNSVIDAAGLPGGAVHIYHDPGPVSFLIENNVLRNGHWGVLSASDSGRIVIRNNTLRGNTYNIDSWGYEAELIVSGNDPDDTVR